MNTTRLFRIGFVTLVAGAVAVATVVVTASAVGLNVSPLAASASASPSPSPQPKQKQQQAQKYCDAFVGHLGSQFGKSAKDTSAAIQKAAGQTIDDAVKNGDLTQKQADALKKRLAGNQSLCANPVAGLGRKPGMGADSKAIVGAAAKSLGMTTDELTAQLKQGKSLHQVADSKNISEATFRASLIQNLTPVLDQAVHDGKLTKNQETQVLQRLQTGPIPLWDAKPGRGGLGHSGAAPASPAPSAAPTTPTS